MTTFSYRASLRTARMQLVADDIDSGSGAGVLKIYTASFATLLAAITLADPCGSVSGDVLTLTTPQSDISADATGDAAIARIENSSGTTIVNNLTVGHTGGSENILLAQATNGIVSGQIVALTSATLTHNTGA